ncbi:MAG: Unknown protein [uncultured Thiotrichaceae bacterium]|uniref:Uncharacterized protein n=1 Tax=uncultured Thiotrichaceae bacterium TaxID=298394 RepID=A0A6S6SQX5_9GAMM|nr:MAG: Unknown protein [uncultured Thiotrichaceae bacterium]
MVEWILNRVGDVLLALLIMVITIWCLLTQPVLSFSSGNSPELGMDPELLGSRILEMASVAETQADQQSRFDATAAYLSENLSNAGVVDVADRGENLHIIHLQMGSQKKRKLFIGMHYVVTANQIPEIIRTAVSLVELTNLLAAQDQMNMQLDLTIFLHKDDERSQLYETLSDASVYHVDQLTLKRKADDIGLLFTPGLRIPDAVYATEQWRYFDLLLPSTRTELSIFGRLRDVWQLRYLKVGLNSQGMSSVNSLSIPVNFPGASDSPLKFYWERDLPVMLVRSNALKIKNSYDSYSKFISALFGLIKNGG